MNERPHRNTRSETWRLSAISLVSCKDAAPLLPAMRDPEIMQEIFSL
jgi:hypothetical protein